MTAIQQRINRELNNKRVGKRIELLVEGVSAESEHLLVGRHGGLAPENDGQVYINDGLACSGALVTIEVTVPEEKRHKPPPTWLAPR